VNRRSARPRVAVVGGAGAMGRITARDLAETAPAIELVIADRNGAAARRLARSLGNGTRGIEVDASDPEALARDLGRAHVIVNACHHSFNLAVMDAAVALGAHYCDLGGLFHVTRKQLKRHGEFKRKRLLALCGIGSAPGIVNVMAQAGAASLDRVHEVHIAVGTRDRTQREGPALLDTSYSILTVLDEASQPAALFTGGKLQFVPALSGGEPVDFPSPVGRMYPARTLHSELATLPASFRGKGIREVSFRIDFPGQLLDRLRFVHALGLTATEPRTIGSVDVVPRDVLLALLADAPRAVASGPPDEYEVLRVIVRGRQGVRRVEAVLDCHVPGMPAWNVGVDIDTGAPPSIAAQMILAGQIAATGVLPPEQVIPPPPFFRQLRRRRMRIVEQRHLWRGSFNRRSPHAAAAAK
jgi:saccharopine dehydrogenase-like NADP-dependent oxidoreductase